MLEAIGSPKTLTVSVAALCIVLFLFRVSQPNLGAVCLLPASVVARLQIYRIATAPFFHGGFFHILFNIIAWMIVARDYEKYSGTLASLYTIFVLLIPLMAVLHCGAAYLIDAIAGTSARLECAVGISGVLFALLVINVERSGGTSVSIFGLFNMPTRWYPLALAGVLQLLSPGLSLMGHLSGIVMGYLVSFGHLDVLTPSDFKLEELERSWNLSSIPLWQTVSASNGFDVLQRGTLPQTNDSPGSSVWERMRGSGGSGNFWFSRSSTSAVAQPFAGQGRPLGSAETPVEEVRPPATTEIRIPAGRVPPNSRLLQEAESAMAASAAARHQEERELLIRSGEGRPTSYAAIEGGSVGGETATREAVPGEAVTGEAVTETPGR